jgi:hypothetical protein
MRSDRDGSPEHVSAGSVAPVAPQSSIRSPESAGAGNPATTFAQWRGFPETLSFTALRPEKLSRRPSRLNREAYHATKAAFTIR